MFFFLKKKKKKKKLTEIEELNLNNKNDWKKKLRE